MTNWKRVKIRRGERPRSMNAPRPSRTGAFLASRAGVRRFPAGDYLIIHRIERDEVVLILHVVHGSRDIAAILA